MLTRIYRWIIRRAVCDRRGHDWQPWEQASELVISRGQSCRRCAWVKASILIRTEGHDDELIVRHHLEQLEAKLQRYGRCRISTREVDAD